MSYPTRFKPDPDTCKMIARYLRAASHAHTRSMPEYDRVILRRAFLAAARIVRGWASTEVVLLEDRVRRCRTMIEESKRAQE